MSLATRETFVVSVVFFVSVTTLTKKHDSVSQIGADMLLKKITRTKNKTNSSFAVTKLEVCEIYIRDVKNVFLRFLFMSRFFNVFNVF